MGIGLLIILIAHWLTFGGNRVGTDVADVLVGALLILVLAGLPMTTRRFSRWIGWRVTKLFDSEATKYRNDTGKKL